MFARFFSDHRLKIPDNPWERMGPYRTADDVMGISYGGHPIAHCLVNCIAKSSAARGYRANFGTHGLHFKHIEFLSADIFFAHVNSAGEVEKGASSCGGYAMLSGTSFSDDAFFAHSFCEKCLPDGIVYFVSARVIKVFPLKQNLGAACFFG